MTTITPTDARKNFFHLPEMVIDDSYEVQISFKQGNITLVDANEYNRLKETVAVLQDPVVASQLEQFSSLKTTSYSSLSDLKNELDA